ncbi:hypothetical protein RCO48_20750 [Peribacillus frigoritolerans]|nr:hypothetical protein [Peribacillus frigoritolerans]
MRSRTFQEYVQGPIQIGMGLGIISLLARWVTGTTILSSPESMVKYGVFGGIGYALMGAIALFMFSFIGKRVRQDFPVGLTIGDYLKARLHPLGYWILIVILVITSLHIYSFREWPRPPYVSFFFDTPLYVWLFFFFRFLCPLCWIRRVKAHSWIRRFSGHIHVCRSYLDSFILFRQGRDSACL